MKVDDLTRRKYQVSIFQFKFIPMIIVIWVWFLSLGLTDGILLAEELDMIHHELAVEFTPEKHFIKAEDRITLMVKEAGLFTFLIGKDLRIKRLLLNGKRVPLAEVPYSRLKENVKLSDKIKDMDDLKGFGVRFNGEGENILDVIYEGVIYDTLKVPERSPGSIPEETSGIISEEGVYLSSASGWYPFLPDDFFFFAITATVPEGFRSVTEGKLVKESNDGQFSKSTWEANYPTKDVTLVAGHYVLERDEIDGITIMAFFFPSEKELIETYIDAAKKYLNMYNRLIGPYPFSKFAIVENFFPTGFGMPSYTLLGRRVIRLPFIVYTSLGHEVAHNWWGNSVYTDYDKGNWCEGLTVYFADHRYKQARSDSAAIDYRRSLDIAFTAYVHEDNDFPLTKFEERTSFATRAIGYGKCAMVFHMLNRIVGEEIFYRALRTFYEKHQFTIASWDDIKNIFEKVSRRDLSFFFDQWVGRKGAPMMTLESASVDSLGMSYQIKVRLKQNPVYKLLVPLSVDLEDTTIVEKFWFSNPETTYIFNIKGSYPMCIQVDKDYDLFRRLSPLEIPPTISSVLGDEALVIVMPSRSSLQMRDVYMDLAKQLARTASTAIKEDTTLTVLDLAKSSFLIMGGKMENMLLSILPLEERINIDGEKLRVASKTYEDPGSSAYVTFRSPFNPEKSICVILGLSPEAVEKSGYKIIHYGKYSFVTFLNGKRQEAGILPVKNNPLVVKFK